MLNLWKDFWKQTGSEKPPWVDTFPFKFCLRVRSLRKTVQFSEHKERPHLKEPQEEGCDGRVLILLENNSSAINLLHSTLYFNFRWMGGPQINVSSTNNGICSGNDRSVLKKFISREVTGNEMGTSVVFRCTLCGKTAAQKNNLLNHIEGIHFPNSFRYNCPYCAKTLTTKNALSVHVHTTHKQQQPQPLTFPNLHSIPGLTFPTLPMPALPMPALPTMPKPWKEMRLSKFLYIHLYISRI